MVCAFHCTCLTSLWWLTGLMAAFGSHCWFWDHKAVLLMSLLSRRQSSRNVRSRTQDRPHGTDCPKICAPWPPQLSFEISWKLTPLPSSRHHQSNDDYRRVRGKIIRSVLCNIVYNNRAQCNAHTWTDLTGLWIGFCLTGPISLCSDSFLYMYVCIFCMTACMCSIVTWWGGPGGIEACP